MDTSVLQQLQNVYHCGQFGRVVFMADELLRDPSHNPLRAQILLWKGMARERTGRAWQGEAISCYREGIAAAGRDKPVKARLMAALGKSYNDLGDCASYDKLMRDYKRIARERDPGVMKWGAYVWYNYGCTLDNAFRYQEAAIAYMEAAELARQSQVTLILWQSLHNLSGVRLDMGDLAGARSAMDEAEQYYPDETMGHKKLSRRAEYALAAGNLPEALIMIEAALQHPRVDPKTKADVHYTWAQTLKAQGHLAEAREKALLALDFAVEVVHYAGIHKTNQFLRLLG